MIPVSMEAIRAYQDELIREADDDRLVREALADRRQRKGLMKWIHLGQRALDHSLMEVTGETEDGEDRRTTYSLS